MTKHIRGEDRKPIQVELGMFEDEWDSLQAIMGVTGLPVETACQLCFFWGLGGITAALNACALAQGESVGWSGMDKVRKVYEEELRREAAARAGRSGLDCN